MRWGSSRAPPTPRSNCGQGGGLCLGTDAGQAVEFADQPFPCHWYLHQANKYGLTQLQRLADLPPRGPLVVPGPLPIVEGSGSPARVLALVDGA
jgi:kynurenine formamidase